MHHLTTLNLPTPSSKEAERQWLAAKVAEAMSRQVPILEVAPGPLVSHQQAVTHIVFNTPHSSNLLPKAARSTGRPSGSTADDSALIERAKAMATLGLSRYATARCLRIGCDRLDRISARHNITFKQAKQEHHHVVS